MWLDQSDLDKNSFCMLSEHLSQCKGHVNKINVDQVLEYDPTHNIKIHRLSTKIIPSIRR